MRRIFLLGLLLALTLPSDHLPPSLLTPSVLLPSGADAPALASAGPIKRASSAIAITSDGAKLLVVNPDSNSLALVDTASHSVLVELPVGLDPRTVAVDDAGERA